MTHLPTPEGGLVWGKLYWDPGTELAGNFGRGEGLFFHVIEGSGLFLAGPQHWKLTQKADSLGTKAQLYTGWRRRRVHPTLKDTVSSLWNF